MAMFPIHRGPMTPEQIARERARIAGLQDQLTVMPTNLGEGLTALGTAINVRQSQKRLNEQFPPPPGGAPQSEASPIQRFAEAVSGNRMPWQFPGAPGSTAAPAKLAPDRTGWNLPMTSQHQGDRQQPPIVFPPPPGAHSDDPFTTKKLGGFFGLGPMVKPKFGSGGLY